MGNALVEVGANDAHTVARSDAPAASTYFRLNVWLDPAPEAGTTEIVAGGCWPRASAIRPATCEKGDQLPLFDQPLDAPVNESARISRLLAPLYDGARVT